MVHYNYSNTGYVHKDIARGAFGKPATKERIEIANNVNKLGDELGKVFAVRISVRGTVSMGLVYRVEKFFEIKEKRHEFDSITNLLGYEIAHEDKHFIYLRKL